MCLQAKGGAVAVDPVALEFGRAVLRVKRSTNPIPSMNRRHPLAFRRVNRKLFPTAIGLAHHKEIGCTL
ncbi:hypothetical protein P3T25_004781 [Paraburkholderia sp. GAS32]|jgi:hypothetical protein